MKNSNIFLNYRRSSKWEAFSIYSALTKELGENHIFIDLEIAPSDKFKEKIENEMNNSHFFVIVISQKWIDAFTIKEKANQFDFVKFEIEYALENNKYVIPILFNNAKFPSQNELPYSIQRLGQFNAISIEPLNFNSSMDVLIALIKDENKNNLAPKKILSLDSSMYDGLIIIETLKALENRIRLLTKDNLIRIQDYYDLIVSGGGISSLITFLLYQGKTVNEIHDLLNNTLPSYYHYNRGIGLGLSGIYRFIAALIGVRESRKKKRNIDLLIKRIFGSSTSNFKNIEKADIDFCIILYNTTLDSYFPFISSEELNGRNEEIQDTFLETFKSSLFNPTVMNPIYVHTKITKNRLIGAGWIMSNPVIPFIDFIKSKLCFQNYNLGASRLFVTSIGTVEKHDRLDFNGKSYGYDFLEMQRNILSKLMKESSEFHIENLTKKRPIKNNLTKEFSQGILSYDKIYITYNNLFEDTMDDNSFMLNPNPYKKDIQQEILKFNLPKII